MERSLIPACYPHIGSVCHDFIRVQYFQPPVLSRGYVPRFSSPGEHIAQNSVTCEIHTQHPIHIMMQFTEHTGSLLYPPADSLRRAFPENSLHNLRHAFALRTMPCGCVWTFPRTLSNFDDTCGRNRRVHAHSQLLYGRIS